MQKHINKIYYKNIYNDIKLIFDNYKKAKIACLKIEHNNQIHYAIEVESEIYDIYQYLKIIDNAINMLDKNGQLIIKNNFINLDEENWWMDYYSRSSYYRHSKYYYEQFLSLINFTEPDISIIFKKT